MSSSQPNPTDNSSLQVTIGGILSIVLSVFFYALRICSRWYQEHRLDKSDCCLAAGLVITIAINATQLWARGYPVHLGRHQDPTDVVQFTATMKGLLAIECIYVFALGFIKLSFLFLYLKLFPIGRFRYVVYFWMTVVVSWIIAIFFASIFQCSPVEALWDITLRPTATCFPVLNFYIAIWVPNIITDLATLVLPQFRIWKLQVDTRTKVGLAFTFLLGSLAIIANIIRFSTLFGIDSMDITYTMSPLALWTSLELAFAIVCASLATLRPLLMLFLNRLGFRATTRVSNSSTAISRTRQAKRLSNGIQGDQDDVFLVGYDGMSIDLESTGKAYESDGRRHIMNSG